ncbi:MAG: pyridoxamine 5'-phosphate oxidase family protein [Bacteroidales bacterium]
MRTIILTKREEMEQILLQSKICYVGMITSEGEPYVLPMNFGYAEGTLYLHSAKEGKHIETLRHNSRVCVTICPSAELKYQSVDVACSYSMKTASVMCHGHVEFVEDNDQKTAAFDIIMKNYSERTFTYSAPALANVAVWKIKVEEMTAKSFGNKFK